MSLTTRSEQRCHGGTIGFYSHVSTSLGLEARFGVFLPGGVAQAPALYALAGLTCNEETFAIKAGALRFAAEHGLAMVFPDTSPRGAGTPGEDTDWDFGTGAGFYLDASEAPWSTHYRMGSYVADELPALIEGAFPVAADRRGITGHSMGGHGALTLALKHPQRWASVSAFAPICHPTDVPWGQKALPRYLGQDPAAWAEHDATLLLRAGHTHPQTILIDQGESDQFLAEQLRPEAFEQTAAAAGQSVTLRRHAGYDHSYWFIQTVIADHLAHHAAILKQG